MEKRNETAVTKKQVSLHKTRGIRRHHMACLPNSHSNGNHWITFTVNCNR